MFKPWIKKTDQEIEDMRILGKINHQILQLLKEYLKPGISTAEIDNQCKLYLRKFEVQSSSLNYKGFPGSLCTSVNEVACHGIPNCHTILQSGDVINIDLAINKNGLHTDSSIMVEVGTCNQKAKRIVQVSHECMLEGIRQVKPGNTLLDIARAVDEYARLKEFVVDDMFGGHGIGRSLHESPHVFFNIPINRREYKNLAAYKLEPGMTFTIEPIILERSGELVILEDNWTAVTADKSLSAQWEHTVLVTSQGFEILT